MRDRSSVLYFDDDVGPWQRIQYPGSLIGSGTGILLASTIIYQYFETFEKEAQSGDFGMFGM